MSQGVLGFLVFIGMVMLIGIPAGIVIWHARTEHARWPKVWGAGTAGAVGTYYYFGGGGGGDGGGGGGCGGGGGGGG